MPAPDESPQKNDAATDRLLKRYETEIDLYKFYMDMSIKGALFAFGLTGALLSYFFTHRAKDKSLVWAICLPVILNAGFFILFRASVRASTKMTEHHNATSRKLNLDPFDTNPLPSLCRILSWMYGLVTIGLIIVMFKYSA